MIQRNVKQSLNALEVFNKLEEKLNTKEISIDYFTTILDCSDVISLHLKDKEYIKIYLKPNILLIDITGLPKIYNQDLTDEEYELIKKRLIKLAQFHQDNFEKWITDITDNNEIDAE